MDPAKQRGMNEKITDKARGMFEKATGYESCLAPSSCLWGLLLFVLARVGLCLLFVFSFVGLLSFVWARVGLCLLLVWLVRRVDGWGGV